MVWENTPEESYDLVGAEVALARMYPKLDGKQRALNFLERIVEVRREIPLKNHKRLFKVQDLLND